MEKKYITLVCSAFVMQIALGQNTWTEKASFGGIERMGAVAFSIGTKGYLGTGGDFGATYYNDFWEYDPALDSWTQKANFPGTARYRALGFSTDSKGYIGTGYSSGSYSDVWEYDPVANSWTAKANMGGFERLGAVSFTIGSKVYAGTGSYFSDFWEYNTITDSWTQKANFGGNAKLYATGFSIGSKGYLGTGVEFSNIGIGTNDFWEYDTTANSWTQKANFPGIGRSEAVGFSIEGYGYIGTGTHNWGSEALSDFGRYDPATDSWSAILSYPDGEVEEATAFVIGCKAYVGTGFTDDNSSTLRTSFWEYNTCSSIAPLASFQVSDSFFCEVTCVDFTDQSAGNPTSWQWSFPGGTPSSSTDQNPANICYYAAGTYDVTLIVANSMGSDTIVLTNFIQVNAAPMVNITQSNDTLYSTFGNSYQWYTGGSPIAGATNYFYVPSAADYYSVVITGSNGCTAADTIFFSPLPQSGFAASDTSICQKFCMDFFDQSTNNPTGWQWNFPGGSPSSSTNQNPTSICYNNPGTYDVTLITSNAFGNDTLTLVNYITIYPTPPFPTITQNGNVLTSSPAVTYQWQLNNIDIPGATMQSYTYTQPGLYTVLVYDSFGCSNYGSILITGVENVPNDFSVSVFANPSNGNFILELINGAGETISLRIVNTLGQEIITQNFISLQNDYRKEIDLFNASPGVYFIGVRVRNEFISKKILVTR